MSKPCSVCRHPQLNEINRALALNAASYDRLRDTYGLSAMALWRHGRKHVPLAMIEAMRASDAAEGTFLLQSVTRLVKQLQDLADDAHSIRHGYALLKAARELRPTLELLGRVTGEVAASQVTVFLANMGLRNEDEARKAAELWKSARDVPPEQALEDGLTLVRHALQELPAMRDYAVKSLTSEASVLEPHHTNGDGNA